MSCPDLFMTSLYVVAAAALVTAVVAMAAVVWCPFNNAPLY